jgi:hypothetical protein
MGQGQDESDFRDSVLADELVQTPSEYVRDQRRQHEDRLEAAEILEGLRQLDSGGDGVRWAIARVGDADPAKNGHLVTWATAQLDADQIRDAFGGGKYYVKGRRTNGDYAGHKTLTIAGDAPRREGAALAPVNGSVSGGLPGSLSDFLTAQERRDRERQERDDRRSEKREQLILASLPAVATVFAAMFSRPQIDMAGLAAALKPAPPADPLIAIAALKQLMPAPASGPSPLEQSLQLVELMLDRAGDSGKTGVLDVVKEGVKILGPTVGSAIEGVITQARTNALAQQNAPLLSGAGHVEPAPALPAPTAAGVTGDPGMLDLLPHVPWLREQLGRCAEAAEKERDPQLYAALFLEELPEGLGPERVVELLSRSDWFQALARMDGRIAAQGPWWAAMREQLLIEIREAMQPAPRRRAPSGEVERPTAPPSLTGES